MSNLGNDFAAIFESSQRDAAAIMRGVNVNCPSLDAAAYLGDRITAAEADARTQAGDVAAARKASDAIKAIAQIDFTPAVAAQIAAVLAGRVGKASWSHFDAVEDALAGLDGASDTLAAITLEAI